MSNITLKIAPFGRLDAPQAARHLVHSLGLMDATRLKQEMLANAAEITRLNARITETLARRSTNPQEWKTACAEFHQRYDKLSFPGGYDDAAERILSGDPFAMEAALCFLELRPYFFRSGYMYKQILRKTKRAPLSPEQSLRLKALLERLAEWRSNNKQDKHAA